MTHWLILLAAGAMMFGLKAAIPVLAGERELPPRLVVLTALAAPAIIGALLAASLAGSGLSTDLLPRVVVLAIGFAVAVRTRSIPLTIAAGLAAHLLMQVFL